MVFEAPTLGTAVLFFRQNLISNIFVSVKNIHIVEVWGGGAVECQREGGHGEQQQGESNNIKGGEGGGSCLVLPHPNIDNIPLPV